MAFQPFGGPIPGENYTSDTKNYPWHRAPEFVDIDPAINWISQTLSDEDASMSIIQMLEMGLSVSTITDLIVTKGIEQGKWAVDLGLLLAGPIAHIIIIMAKGYEVEFEIGIEPDNKDYRGKAFFNAVKEEHAKPSKKQIKEVKQAIENEIGSEGFMPGMMGEMK